MKHGHTIKVAGTIIILTAIIIGLSFFTRYLLDRDSLRLVQAIDEIETGLKNEEWNQAESGLKKVNALWSDVKEIWSSLIDHQEIDNIDVTISRLQILVENRDVSSSLSEAAALKNYIGHIPAKEKLGMDNLF